METNTDRPLILAAESAATECRGSNIGDDPALPYDAVVVAFAPTQFDYVSLNTAFRVLVNEHETQRGQPRLDYPFIATHRSRYVGDSDGALSLGPGPFVAALENASGRTAEIVGKPERKFFELVLSSLESDVQGREGVVAVVGDDIQSDLGGGAVELGFWRVLGVCIPCLNDHSRD
jgi:ribonucleotide monophosphatase NagD (HAD superfamily)